jgi:tetratricopeptide (TPR) repeat protein
MGFDRAIADFDKAIELNPRLAQAHNGRGLAYRDKNELDKAIADFSKAIELDPNSAEAYFNRAYAYHRKGGEVAKAASDLEKCIELSTDPRLLDAAKQLLERL